MITKTITAMTSVAVAVLAGDQVAQLVEVDAARQADQQADQDRQLQPRLGQRTRRPALFLLLPLLLVFRLGLLTTPGGGQAPGGQQRAGRQQ
jgi:hypothetical protein